MVIHLAVAFDENYLRHFYSLAASVFENNKANQIHFHVIFSGVGSEKIETLRNYISRSRNIISFYEIDRARVNKLVLLNKWTSAVYYRLFFPLLVPESISRVLYLDTDVTVNGSLEELYIADLGDYPLGAVYDNFVKSQPLLNIHDEGEYFNSGVLLIDIKRWKQQGITEMAIQYLSVYPERILFVDQCALNAVLTNNWKKLPEKYNLIYSYVPQAVSFKKLREFVQDKVIIHYTLQRPWNMLCTNRLGYLYHRYLKMSPEGKCAKKYTDFQWRKIPAFLQIKLMNLYFDLPGLQSLWQTFKDLLYDQKSYFGHTKKT